MRFLIFVFLFVGLSATTTSELKAQDKASYIYGKITTHSGEEYVGFMRWGKEELFWHDIFNSEKIDDQHYKVAKKSNQKDNKWYEFDWSWSSIWEDKYRTSAHTFACLFGDIKSIDVLRDSKVIVELKDGSKLNLRGGSNDIGTTVKLTDYELGLISFDWNKIDKIEFLGASSRVELPYAAPIYGTLHTRRNGQFTGFVKWDLDERTLEDVLDGDSNIGDQKLPFKSIKTITKEGNGAHITLKSGREIYLTGSNDVNGSNRGIALYHEDIGSIEVPWKEFKSLTLADKAPAGPSYESFEAPKGLSGVVQTYNDKRFEGMLVFDIDEKYEIELLDGNDDAIEYQIPFRNITKILPKNSSYSIVRLTSGDELLLGDSQDVSAKNDGILVFVKNQKDPHYIAWDDIDFVQINK
ncbi:MAG: hypothetical protein HKN09_10105 [Saprospiraceae bacterium]|nr:hypothetical protein [Saprospiraceae bacterium]